MAVYTPPLRDMHFVLHELLNVTDELKMLPAHADIDADTINAVLEEGGKFAAEVTQNLRTGTHGAVGRRAGGLAFRALAALQLSQQFRTVDRIPQQQHHAMKPRRRS